MFGFVIGAASLAGLIALLTRGRCLGRYPGKLHRGGVVFLRHLFERLDTTPGQERVIREELGKMRRQGKALRNELRESRNDAARALRGEIFDENLFAAAFERQDDRLRTARLEVTGAFNRIYDALEPRQRERLATMLERGPMGGAFHGGPYREGRGPDPAEPVEEGW